MAYNAAVVNRLHPEQFKKQLANIMINNASDIIRALRKPDDQPKTEVETVVTGDEATKTKKVKK